MSAAFRRLLPLVSFISALLAACPAGAQALERGVAAFKQGDYAAAQDAFREELTRLPNDPLASLWLGLAVHATGGAFDGATEWRAATGHDRYEPMAELFRGLTYWKAGYVNDARAYFKEALLNVRDGQPVDFAPARQALADLDAGRPMPAFAAWPALAGLPEARPRDAAAAAPAQPAPAPVRPRPEAGPAAGPAPQVRAPAGYVPWEPFGAHRVGDKVLFRVVNGEWRVGVVQEVGTQGVFANKYLVAEEGPPYSRDYYYHTDVTGLQRQEFWTGFFVGDWALGSGMAVNERVEGGAARNEYLYVGATERLVVRPDGTFSWTTLDKRQVNGRWEAHPTAPGIVLRRGDRDRDYDVFNITDPATVGVMKEHHIRLQTPGIQSTLGRRPIPAAR